MTRKQAYAVARVFRWLAQDYDDHVLEKVSVEVLPGNNVVIKWDDMSEDDVEDLRT